MKSRLVLLKSPAIISFLLILPFVIMEVVNRRNFHEEFPIFLFFVMWLLLILFILILMPLAQNRGMILANPINLFIRVIALILFTWLWISLLADQLPCFMGVPNCD